MHTFRSMNTDVAVTAPGHDEAALANDVAQAFWLAELRFSRFRADSELSWLNRARGPVTVSEELFAVLTRARAYLELTHGLFDPAVGGCLCALGYDRSFAPAVLDREQQAVAPRAACFLEVRLDAARRTVERPEYLQIDLGGMVKGMTVDAAAALLPATATLDAGGDAMLRGAGPSHAGWLVDVEDPFDAARSIATVRVSERAVATSAANRRRWRVGSGTAHHLIDPRTQRSAASDVVQATVFAPRAELADVLAKTAFLLGSEAATRFFEALPDIGALLVLQDGAPQLIGALEVLEVHHG